MSNFIDSKSKIKNSKLINCVVINSTIENNCELIDCVIIDSFIKEDSIINNCKISDSRIINVATFRDSIVKNCCITDCQFLTDSVIENCHIDNIFYLQKSNISGSSVSLHDIIEIYNCTFKGNIDISLGGEYLNIFIKCVLRGDFNIKGSDIINSWFKCDGDIKNSKIEDCKYIDGIKKSFLNHVVNNNEIVYYNNDYKKESTWITINDED